MLSVEAKVASGAESRRRRGCRLRREYSSEFESCGNGDEMKHARTASTWLMCRRNARNVCAQASDVKSVCKSD